MNGHVDSIYICETKSGPMLSAPEVKVVRGRGIEGDRYFFGEGTFSKNPRLGREVTLIEAEAVEAIGHEAGIHIGVGDARRNIVTRGVPLNHLVGREFRVGEVTLRGTKLCEPCAHLEEMTEPGLRAALTHRGGLCAEIVEDGIVHAGDTVEVDPAAPEAIPILRVEDAARAAEWYARLGFHKEWEHRFEPELPAFVSMARGPARVFLSEHTGDARPDTLLYVRVDDIDRIAAEFGVEIERAPWAREIELRDPDGNRLRIGTPH